MASTEAEGEDYIGRTYSGDDTGVTRYWLSMDLGLMGDYSRIYEWLDAQEAFECGPGTAMIVSKKSLNAMVEEIRGVFKEAPRARVYLLAKQPDGRFGGKFVLGSRRKAPWAGFAVLESDAVEIA